MQMLDFTVVKGAHERIFTLVMHAQISADSGHNLTAANVQRSF
jgi:hypothetical protein